MTDREAIIKTMTMAEAILYVGLGGPIDDLPRPMRIGVMKSVDRASEESTGRECRALRIVKRGHDR